MNERQAKVYVLFTKPSDDKTVSVFRGVFPTVQEAMDAGDQLVWKYKVVEVELGECDYGTVVYRDYSHGLDAGEVKGVDD